VTAVRTANAAVFVECDVAFTAGTFVAHTNYSSSESAARIDRLTWRPPGVCGL
jgi:hypothetical protein